MRIKGRLLIGILIGMLALFLNPGIWSYSAAWVENHVFVALSEPEHALIATEFLREAKLSSDGKIDDYTIFGSDGTPGMVTPMLKVTNNLESVVEIMVDFEKDCSGITIEDPDPAVLMPGVSVCFPVLMSAGISGQPAAGLIKATVTARWDNGSAVVEDFLVEGNI